MAFEDTNPWAAYFAQEKEKRQAQMAKAQEKAAATRQYKSNKPQCIRYLEITSALNGNPKVYDDRTANGLTDFILDYLKAYGHYGARINIGGIYLADKGKYRASGSTKGVADVIACIKGRFCQFEVKAGKDRPRQDQLEQQQLTRSAGGVYEFVHNAEEFHKIVLSLR